MTFPLPVHSRLRQPGLVDRNALIGSSALIVDTFNAANGTSLNGRTPDITTNGATWSNATGAYDIQSGRANCSTVGGGGFSVATINAAYSDTIYTATLNFSSSVVGLIFRYASSSAFWIAVIDALNGLRLFEYLPGFTLRASTPATFVAGTDYTMRVTTNGTSISVVVGSVSLSYTSSANLTATTHGLYSGATGNRYGDLQITRSTAVYAVGTAFTIGGQSNGMGKADGNNQSYTGTALAYEYAQDYTLKALADPVSSASGQVDTVVSCSNAAGSVWPLVANAFDGARAASCTMVPCASSGSGIVSWLPDANRFDRTTLYGSLVHRAQITGSVVVLWWQGETDALNGMAQATYLANLTTLANALFADIGLSLLPCKLQACSSVSPTSNLTAIQNAIAQGWGTGHILTGPDFSDIAADDGLHIQTTPKLQTCAARWWSAIVAAGL